MKQHFFLIVVSMFIALIVVSVVTQFINPADAFDHLLKQMTADPNDTAQKLATSSS